MDRHIKITKTQTGRLYIEFINKNGKIIGKEGFPDVEGLQKHLAHYCESL